MILKIKVLNMTKIKISEMTGKLKDIPAINTNPLTNPFCKQMSGCGNSNIICTECYSCSMLKAYRRNCVPAFERNSIALADKDLAQNDLPEIKKNDIVRIHAHGELIDGTHLNNILRIVNKNPTKIFSLYTKRVDLINSEFDKSIKPANLILVYSNPQIDAPITNAPPHFDKVFNVVRATNLNNINCGANDCNSCRRCYDKTKENIIYEMIK